MVPTLSILAPTHDRPQVLARVWPTWLDQEGLKEIVVVDDGSKEDYSSVFRDLAFACEERGIEFKPMRLPRRHGSPAAKNAGLNLCTGQETLTTDDDVQLPPNMVQRCRSCRPAGSNPMIVGPRVIYLKDGENEEDALQRSSCSQTPYFDLRTLTLTPWAGGDEVSPYPFVTAIALWPTELFRRGLRYYEEYGGNGYREESDPQLTAATQFGATVFLIPQAHCFHLPPSIAYAKKGGQRRGGRLWFEWWVLKNNLVFLARHREILKNKYKVNPAVSWWRLFASRFSISRVLRALRGRPA